MSVCQHQVLSVSTQSCCEQRYRHRWVSLHSGHLQGTHWRQRLLTRPMREKYIHELHWTILKGSFTQEWILSLITHPCVVPNPQDLRSSSEHKSRYFWWILRALWPSIDSKDPYTIKAQKHSKEIRKILHVTSVFQSYENTFSVQRKQHNVRITLVPFWRILHS